MWFFLYLCLFLWVFVSLYMIFALGFTIFNFNLAHFINLMTVVRSHKRDHEKLWSPERFPYYLVILFTNVISSLFSLPECVPYCTDWEDITVIKSDNWFPRKKALSDGYISCLVTNDVIVTSPTSRHSESRQIRLCQQEGRLEVFSLSGWSCCCCFHRVSSLRVKKLNSQPCILKITQWFVKENHNLKRECVVGSKDNGGVSRTGVTSFHCDSSSVTQLPGKSGGCLLDVRFNVTPDCANL